MKRTTLPSVALALLSLIGPAAALAQEPAVKASAKKSAPPLTLVEARTFFGARDWARAAEAYQEVLRSNPHDGEHWFNHGMCLYSLKQYDQAIKSLEKASELSFRPEDAAYNVACCLALAGRKDEALSALEKAIETGFNQDGLLHNDSDLETLRQDPRFKKLIGAAPEGLSRAERWAFDLDYLKSRMEKVHYNLYARVSREKFQSAVNELKSRVESLSDAEIAAGVQGILASVGDGHTTVMFEAARNARPAVLSRRVLRL